MRQGLTGFGLVHTDLFRGDGARQLPVGPEAGRAFGAAFGGRADKIG